MKSNEELNALKTEYENLSKKLNELTQEEMKEVTGGWFMKGWPISLPEETESVDSSRGDKGNKNWSV